jgi:hypothetical protein
VLFCIKGLDDHRLATLYFSFVTFVRSTQRFVWPGRVHQEIDEARSSLSAKRHYFMFLEHAVCAFFRTTDEELGEGLPFEGRGLLEKLFLFRFWSKVDARACALICGCKPIAFLREGHLRGSFCRRWVGT